jgi:hypothetical protein
MPSRTVLAATAIALAAPLAALAATPEPGHAQGQATPIYLNPA